MKLLSCYVKSFGKLNNFSYNFCDRINTIKEDNGWGKTTLSVFIKSMFYGLDNGRKDKVDDSDRKKYFTWNSTTKIGGYLDFEVKGQKYRVERFFGLKPSDDIGKLIDLSSMIEYPDKDLGKRIFKIDEEGFNSTIFFSQKDFDHISPNGIGEKLRGGNDENSLGINKVIDNLSSKAKEYKSLRGEKGSISEINDKIFKLNQEITEAKTGIDSEKVLKEKIRENTEKFNQIKIEINKYSVLKDKLGREQSVIIQTERLSNIQKEKTDLLKKNEIVDKKLNGNKIDNNYLDDIKNIINDKKENDKKALEYSTELQAKSKNNFNIYLLIFGIVLLFGGAVCLALASVVVGAIICAIGIVLISFSFVFVGNNKALNKESQGLNGYKKISDDCEKELNTIFSRYNLEGISFEEKWFELKDLIRQSNEIEIELKKINDEIEDLKKQLSIVSVDKSITMTLEQVNIKFDELNESCNALSMQIAQDKASLISYEPLADKIEYNTSCVLELKDKLVEQEEQYNVLIKTIDLLKKADQNIKAKYRSPLENSLNNYLKTLSNNKDISATIDTNLVVKIIENGVSVDIDYYSKGYKSLFVIAERLAIIDSLFEGEKPFIILDDPFADLDETRLNEAVNLIKNLSKNFQIIYFVCHDSRKL